MDKPHLLGLPSVSNTAEDAARVGASVVSGLGTGYVLTRLGVPIPLTLLGSVGAGAGAYYLVGQHLGKPSVPLKATSQPSVTVSAQRLGPERLMYPSSLNPETVTLGPNQRLSVTARWPGIANISSVPLQAYLQLGIIRTELSGAQNLVITMPGGGFVTDMDPAKVDFVAAPIVTVPGNGTAVVASSATLANDATPDGVKLDITAYVILVKNPGTQDYRDVGPTIPGGSFKQKGFITVFQQTMPLSATGQPEIGSGPVRRAHPALVAGARQRLGY